MIRRALFALAVFTLAAVSVALMAGPQAPDEKEAAQKAFDSLQAKLAVANSAVGRIEVRMLGRVETYDFKVLRRNYAKFVSHETGLYQDGKRFYDFSFLDNEYSVRPAPQVGLPAGTGFSLGGVAGLESLAFPNEPKLEAVSISRKSFSGIPATAISLQSVQDSAIKVMLYISIENGLPLGWNYQLRDFKSSGRFRSLGLNADLKPSDFAWAPPPGAKKIGE